jgi:hypothetical protein
MVHASRAKEARVLLAETLVEDETDTAPEIANTGYLKSARGGRLRGYGLVGAYARIYLFSLGAVAVTVGILLLLRIG